MKRTIIFAVLILLVAFPALAKEVSVSFIWEPNPVEDEITGYRLYRDCGGPECRVAEIENPAAASFLYTFEDGKVSHVFSLTAYRIEEDATVTESLQSAYAIYFYKPTPPRRVPWLRITW